MAYPRGRSRETKERRINKAITKLSLDAPCTMMYNIDKGGDTVYTKKDVCEIFQVSLGTVNNWIKRGRLKVVKIDRSVRIAPEEIERLKKGG